MSAHRAEPPRGFALAEYEQRTARAQRLMASAELDALLLTTEPEVRYFSGFQTQFWASPTRPWFLMVHEEDIVIREGEAELLTRRARREMPSVQAN